LSLLTKLCSAGALFPQVRGRFWGSNRVRISKALPAVRRAERLPRRAGIWGELLAAVAAAFALASGPLWRCLSFAPYSGHEQRSVLAVVSGASSGRTAREVRDPGRCHVWGLWA